MLIGGHFLQAFGYSTMLLLPLYLDYLNASRTEIGAIMASAAVGGLIFRPLVGWSLDVLGRRPTLIAGTIMLAAGMGLVFFVHTIGPLVYVQRVVMGIGTGALFTGYFTFAADLVPESRRTEGIALFGISGLLPLGLNPVVREIGISSPDLRFFFPVVGGIILLSLLFIVPLKEPPREAVRTRVGIRGAIRALTKKRLIPVWCATLVFAGLVAVFFTFATVTAEHRGVGRPAAIWFAYAVAACTVRLGGGRLPDRVGTWNIVAPAVGCYGVASLLVASGWSTQAFLLAGVFAGIGHGYCFPVLASQVVTRTPNFLRGSGLAMYTALWELSRLVLTPMYGYIADRFDDATMFSLLVICSVFVLAIWAVLEHTMGRER